MNDLYSSILSHTWQMILKGLLYFYMLLMHLYEGIDKYNGISYVNSL